MKAKKTILDTSFSAMFLALAYVLPFITGQVPELGNALCLMHIPVLLCGFVCGPQYGLLVGAVAPILRSLTLGAPEFFPRAVTMAFELAFYGLIAGLLYKALPKKKLNIYISLLGAMIGGRVVSGLVKYCLFELFTMGYFTGTEIKAFSLAALWTSTVVNAIPGIILQIILIPIIVMIAEKMKFISDRRK